MKNSFVVKALKIKVLNKKKVLKVLNKFWNVLKFRKHWA